MESSPKWWPAAEPRRKWVVRRLVDRLRSPTRLTGGGANFGVLPTCGTPSPSRGPTPANHQASRACRGICRRGRRPTGQKIRDPRRSQDPPPFWNDPRPGKAADPSSKTPRDTTWMGESNCSRRVGPMVSPAPWHTARSPFPVPRSPPQPAHPSLSTTHPEPVEGSAAAAGSQRARKPGFPGVRRAGCGSGMTRNQEKRQIPRRRLLGISPEWGNRAAAAGWVRWVHQRHGIQPVPRSLFPVPLPLLDHASRLK